MVQPRRYVEAPATQPAPYGLLSAATVIDDGDAHLGMGVEYESTACGDVKLTAAECFPAAGAADPDPLGDSIDDGRTLVGADAFQVFVLHTCRLVGMGGQARAQADAAAKLGNGEGRAIEAQLAAQLADADDLTPTLGTAVTPLAGLAILEDYAGSTYGGVPTLHMSRGEATILGNGGALERMSGRLETVVGSRVAAGGGYSAFSAIEVGDVTPDAGSHWLWVTGQVVVRRGAVDTTDLTIGAHTPKNEGMILAQRSVVITTECISAAVLVTSPAVAASLDGGGA